MVISSSKAGSILSLTLFFFFFLSSATSSDNNNILVYRQCKNHTFPDPKGSLPQILSSLLQELVVQSSQSKFYETSTGDENIAISGLFQCRNDLSKDECHNCVNRLPKLSHSFCGNTIPARIHLSGCHIHYRAESADHDQYSKTYSTSKLELQHHTCSETKSESDGFQELRDAAFAALESSVTSSGNGFCDMTYESMHLTAQCDGNLVGCDCGQCVNNAVQTAQDECGNSLSGEVYLDSCFITYSYTDNGIPTYFNQGEGTKNVASVKLIAIIVGGGAALILGGLLVYLCRSCGKKSDDDW